MKSPNQRDVLVAIPLFNGELWIEACLKSVLENSVDVDILVIDNASTDSGVNLVKTRFNQVRILQNQHNVGFGRAINYGFEIAQHEGYQFVLVLNQDATLKSDTLYMMLEFAKTLNEKAWSLISPIHLDARGENREFYFDNNLREHSNSSDIKNSGQFQFQEVDFINAACWLVNVSALQVMGGFNPRFFMYGEDLDFCNRSKWKGLKMYLLLNAHCLHHKEKGEYEGNPAKMMDLKVGEQMAWYLNPNVDIASKLWRFIKITLVAIHLMVFGNATLGLEKWRVNVKAFRRSLL